ncbi:MAG: FtsW/RodA/SpoVE family cell cycle protein [Peptococcaceae bacterium]
MPVTARLKERTLLLVAGTYFLAGLGTIYIVRPVDNKGLFLTGTGVLILAFFALSYLWQRFNFSFSQYLLPLVAVFSYTGLIFLYRLNQAYALRQFIWLLIGLTIVVAITFLWRNYNFLADYKYIYAVLGIIGLVLPIFWGIEQGGAKSWLNLGLFHIQTSEFVKILLVLFLASFLTENRLILTKGTRNFYGFTMPGPQEWGPLVGMWVISLLLLIFQKDLGGALIYFGTFLAMIYVATARIIYTICGAGLFLIGTVLCYHYFEHIHWRIEVWLNPWPYADTAGYQVLQSLFAISAGGFTGAGLGSGFPNFIPAVHTDFIFAAITEEIGLLGGIGIIVLYLLFLYHGFQLAIKAKDEFAALLASGLTALIGLQTFVIIAGVTKLLPLTGITLPFISYGGSSLVANFIILGLLLVVSQEYSDRSRSC